ncbi:MAG TPA: hypothetical protein VII69_06360 [Candidatus Eremiobacteraceae bacterium]
MPKKNDFDGAFKGLRRLLTTRAQNLYVKRDAPGEYYVETKEPLWKGKRLFVAAVKTNKNYVSFHFVLVYMYPDLLSNMSPALKKRMQGKGCFNFTAPDPALFAELSDVVDAGFKAFKKRGMPA